MPWAHGYAGTATHPTMKSVGHGFTLLEFALVVTIVAIVVYALIPRIGASLKFSHETVVSQTAMAFRVSLKLVAAKFVVARQGPRHGSVPTIDLAGAGNGMLDLNAAGNPVGTDWSIADQRALQSQDCLALWYGLLGGLPPSAATVGDSHFRVLTTFDARNGLGCNYRYLRGGDMAIGYFPETGQVTVDARF